jgi:hypothetical protein
MATAPEIAEEVGWGDGSRLKWQSRVAAGGWAVANRREALYPGVLVASVLCALPLKPGPLDMPPRPWEPKTVTLGWVPCVSDDSIEHGDGVEAYPIVSLDFADKLTFHRWRHPWE